MSTYKTFQEWLTIKEAEQKPGMDEFDREAEKDAVAMSRMRKQQSKHKPLVKDAAKEAPKDKR